MKSKQIIYQVDAFTAEPFRGNPAGVCILDNVPENQWMQNVAMEMNLSETVFVLPGKAGERMLRFFTPETEVNLCGHATLSASHILFETGFAEPMEELRFSSKSGDLKVKKQNDWISMDFPAFSLNRIEITAEFRKITGINPLELHRSEQGWILALLRDEEEVRNLRPFFSQMKDSDFGDLIVTAPSADSRYDFCLRCFAPAQGINEDPVTGSAHCALVPFWVDRKGKTSFISHQVSKREGTLKVALKRNRVEISGQAVTVLRAELFV